jgi:NAD(P)-dependent dehydrogenase (short-subunit alcohol dehydrogenase family)
MKIDLSGKLALITGSTSGIGYAVATGLAQAGAEIVINGRRRDSVDAAVTRAMRAVPAASVRGVAADVGSAEGCAALIESAPQVDILINNAALFGLKSFFEIDDAEWRDSFEVNVMSGVRLARAYLDGMLKRSWGRVVFMCSESGLEVPADSIAYGATKTAQLGVSRGLAQLTRGTGVTVNVVVPGPTRSDGADQFLEAAAARAGVPIDDVAADLIKQRWPNSLLQRFASVEEVANMVVYLCSREASATNGAAVRVDGGVLHALT